MKVFKSLSELGAHLDKAVSLMEAVQHHALEKCAQIVERRAKEKIATYQDAVGPFAAWAPLSDATLYGGVSESGFHYPGKIELGYAPPDNPLLRTGEMRDSVEHRVDGSSAYIGSNSDVAVYQEIGTEKIPPRSFLGGARAEKAPEVCQILGRAVGMSLVAARLRRRF
jgi:hypothetical protein